MRRPNYAINESVQNRLMVIKLSYNECVFIVLPRKVLCYNYMRELIDELKIPNNDLENIGALFDSK